MAFDECATLLLQQVGGSTDQFGHVPQGATEGNCMEAKQTATQLSDKLNKISGFSVDSTN